MIRFVRLLSLLFLAFATATAAQPDIYLLMGQSNMAGRGVVEAEDKPEDPRLLVFNREGKWVVAAEPLHWDKPKIAGVGPGLAFAKAMAAAQPGVTIGLVPCAVGGTPLSRWEHGGDLYKAALARAKAAAATGTLKGILWHQGEGDAHPPLSGTYAQRLQQMIRDLRADLGTPELPVVVGELGPFLIGKKGSDAQTINDALHATAKALPNVACAEATGLKHKGDVLHFDAPSQRDFGKRYAAAMLALQKDSRR
jgi:hypothetical protein